MDIYEDDIASLEEWLLGKKTEIENIIDLANSNFSEKLSEIQAKLDETNQAIVNGDFYSKTETDQKLSAINTTITNHTSNKTNPHAVTAEQVGSYTKAEVANLINQAKLDANPIGTILTTISNTNPSTYIGGTWERFANGRTLVSVDETDDITLMKTANNTGGSVNPLTKHGHNIRRANGTQQSAIGATISWSDLPNNGGVIQESGDNTNHNNWQPFVTVYFWRRTA
ncbi:MAG: phage baseplate protein [Lactococcus raffinolactis]|uniref:phage baseplate protein n=1 Tax=Pseudolactococcus raffinolactis TaxID=1366 RepID=UPI003992381D